MAKEQKAGAFPRPPGARAARTGEGKSPRQPLQAGAASAPVEFRPLFRSPGNDLAESLDKALAASAKVFKVPSGRMADLPLAVRDLSLLLTAERGGLARSYWASPRFVAAYLRYFLPWNLFRLAWLLPGLDLALKPGARILDLGSGPLTLPLALWLARPETRNLELEIVCSDVSPKIMEHGRDIFYALAGKDSPWRISLVRATADKAPRLVPRGSVQLLMAGNILNEMAEQQGKGEGGAARRLEFFCNSLSTCLSPGGRALLVEPGSRLGGSLISLCREAALEQGLVPLAPCTHAGRCPLMPSASSGVPTSLGPSTSFGAGQGLYGRGGGSWCHFSLPARGVPAPLAALSAKAGLEKERMSLSFLLLEAAGSGSGQGIAQKPEYAKGCDGDCSGGRDEEDSLSLPDELDELEALYEELRAQDAGGGNLWPGRPESERGCAGSKKGRALSASGGAASGTQRPDFGAEGPGVGPERSIAGEELQGMQGLRVVSGPIVLPGRERAARYVCGAFGLGLLLDAEDLHAGSFVRLRVELVRRDAKSGAWLIERGGWADRPGCKTGAHAGARAGAHAGARAGTHAGTREGKAPEGKRSKSGFTAGGHGAKGGKSSVGKGNKPGNKAGKAGGGKQ